MKDPANEGKVEIETSVTVPRDNPLLGFTCRQYYGSEVYRDQPDPVDRSRLEPLTDPALRAGQTLLYVGLMGELRRQTAACYTYDGKQHWTSQDEGLICFLSFGEDDRRCWVATSCADRRALERVDFV